MHEARSLSMQRFSIRRCTSSQKSVSFLQIQVLGGRILGFGPGMRSKVRIIAAWSDWKPSQTRLDLVFVLAEVMAKSMREGRPS